MRKTLLFSKTGNQEIGKGIWKEESLLGLRLFGSSDNCSLSFLTSYLETVDLEREKVTK